MWIIRLSSVDNNTFILAQVKGCSPQQPFFFFPFASLKWPNVILGMGFCTNPELCQGMLEVLPKPVVELLEERVWEKKELSGSVGLRLAPGTAVLPEHNRALSSPE